MSYPKRYTAGRIDCRPKIFKKDIFIRNNFLCNSNCPYNIFCMAENKKLSLGDRIKELRLSFQKPYYYFSMSENGDTMLVFENDAGEKLSFRTPTMIASVTKAEDFLAASRIRSGQEMKAEEQKEDTPEEKKDDGIDITTTVKDGEGKEHSIEG